MSLITTLERTLGMLDHILQGAKEILMTIKKYGALRSSNFNIKASIQVIKATTVKFISCMVCHVF